MATILQFAPRRTVRSGVTPPHGPAEIVIFPGVRVEYHGDRDQLDLASRIGPAGHPARRQTS